MTDRPATTSNKSAKSNTAKIVLAIIGTALAAGLVAGGTVYLWQKTKLDAAYLKLQQQEQVITTMQDRTSLLDERNADLQKKINEAANDSAQSSDNQTPANDAAPAGNQGPANNQAAPSAPVASAASGNAGNIDFPVVTYARKGLLTDHPAGLADLQKLQQKLIDPYTDYNNESALNLVALHITVPVNIGDPYTVLGIFGSDQQYGTEEFEFGKREQNFDYWHPECMGPCPFTPAFSAKYPQIVNP